MKFRALILAIALSGLAELTARAADEENSPGRQPPARRRAQLTEEQKALMKEIREKYDKDKNGQLSADERKAISEEDKARMEKAGISARGRPPRPGTPEAPK
jgi:hypothetical protein